MKGGGHASNPAFSSTTGVQIAMARFNEVNYNSKTGAVDIGPGLIWDDVYAALEPYGVNVVGGRVTGVGVAGFILGGGQPFFGPRIYCVSTESFQVIHTNRINTVWLSILCKRMN